MSDTIQSALAEQGTTPAKQQGKDQRSTAAKARSALQAYSTFSGLGSLMGFSTPFGQAPAIANAVVNGPAMMQGLANMIGAGVAAFGGNDPNVGGSISSSIADTYGKGQGGMFGGSGAEAYDQAGLLNTTAARGLSVEEALQSGLYGDIVGGEGGGVSSGGGDYGGGQEARGVAMGGLVAPRGTGGLQDLMRGYI